MALLTVLLKPGVHKIYKSARFGNLSAYSWKIPLTVFTARNTSARFGAFVRERIFRASGFWSKAKFGCGNELRDNFGRLFALSCGHRQGISLVFKASASSANDPGGFLRCGQLRECLGNLPESTRTVPTTLGANDDPTRNWSGSCRESPGSRGSHAEAMQKPRESHEAMRKPRGRF